MVKKYHELWVTRTCLFSYKQNYDQKKCIKYGLILAETIIRSTPLHTENLDGTMRREVKFNALNVNVVFRIVD